MIIFQVSLKKTALWMVFWREGGVCKYISLTSQTVTSLFVIHLAYITNSDGIEGAYQINCFVV